MALIRGMLRANLCSADEIIVSGRSRAALDNVVATTGTCPAASNAEAVAEADTVLLCVKPDVALKVLGRMQANTRGAITSFSGHRFED